MPKSVYLKTSRRCVSVAAIREAQDIIRLSERKFSGTVADFFRQRFGIEVPEEGEWITGSGQASALLYNCLLYTSKKALCQLWKEISGSVR